MGDGLVACVPLAGCSCSDRIAEARNLHYRRADYLRLIERLCAEQPNIAFSSDFIVGFPGETEDDFKATLSLVDAVGYAGAFSFKYSARPGTPAPELPDQVPEAQKSERPYRLPAAIDRNCARSNAQRQG